MEAVVYSNFRNNLKDYMKKVNDEYEPLMVVNKNPDENIVVLSKENWDSIQETIRLMNNEYLSDKVLSGMEQVKQKKVVQRQLLEVEDV
jgi:antitoxin YefM